VPDETAGRCIQTRKARRVPARHDLEPYGYEFLLSPMLRVRLRPASARENRRARSSRALGSVLGVPPPPGATRVSNEDSAFGHPLPALAGGHGYGTYAGAAGPLGPASASPAVQPYASAFVEPAAGPLELPPVPRTAYVMPRPQVDSEPARATRVSGSAPPRTRTVLEPGSGVPVLPPLAHTAWELGHGTQPAAALDAPAPLQYEHSLEALALRGLRELAASLLPGQSVETAGDVVQLVTKLHDALEMFCRCFIPVREACSRQIAPEELERAARERCRNGSDAYLAVERALEPAAVAAALLDWRNAAQDAPRAVEHILADLMLQQLLTLHSAFDGTRALLDELSPARIEAGAPRSPSVMMRLGLAGTRERLLWEAYRQRHAELASAGDAFSELFGEAFSWAYQAARSGSGPP
jgi:hypothetical protein